MTHCLIILRQGGDRYAVRWQAAHPLSVYAVLERWLREGVVDICEFNVCLGAVCQAANVAREVTE